MTDPKTITARGPEPDPFTFSYEVHVDTVHFDTNRGYHDRNAAIEFRYDSPMRTLSEVSEREIIEAMCRKSDSMWFRITSRDVLDNKWTRYHVNYGYDSGD